MTAGSYRQTLAIPGLQSFLWTQFLGAFNDNVYKIIVSFVAIRSLGAATGMPLAAAIFVLPFFLFSGWSGHLADAFSKRSVLVWTKVLEIVAMGLAIPAMLSGRLDLQLAVLFLMGTQSTLFSPAKYGIVPEIVPATDISRANGLLEMSTFGAIILGTGIGGALYEAWQDSPWVMGSALVGIAVLGTVTSLGIPHVSAASGGRRFAVNPLGEIGVGLKRIAADRILLVTVVGISYFWFLGALLQQVVIPWGQESFGVGEAAATRLYTFLAIGIGAGSMAAGRLSGNRVELGLVTLGGTGLGVLSLLLVPTVPYYPAAASVLVLLGFFGGLFAVPLNALLQQRPDEHERGRIMATNNVLNTVAMLASAAAFWVLGGLAGLTLSQVILVAGLFTVAFTAYVALTVPDFFVRFVLWASTTFSYRVSVSGVPAIPAKGPALIVANYVSSVDAIILAAALQRSPRFIVDSRFARGFKKRLLRHMHVAIVDATTSDEMSKAVAWARTELTAGHVILLFADGHVSRTAPLVPFHEGLEAIVRDLDVPIVPVYIDREWRGVSPPESEPLFKTRAERVVVGWGQPISSTTVAAPSVRQLLSELGAETLGLRRTSDDRLQFAFLASARRHWSVRAMADTTGVSLTYGRALLGSIAISRVVARRTRGQKSIGLLLPASVGGALANIAVLIARQIPINLNFTIGREALETSIAQAGITTILTSRKFLEKTGMAEMPSMLFLEDLRTRIGITDKLAALFIGRILPKALVRRVLHTPGETAASPLATIIFSSGSTGVPKGVMLTHANVLSNIDSAAQLFALGPGDCFVGVLPFFHSFGFTDTIWFPLLHGAAVAYHPNPTEAKIIGDLVETHKATMLISTPTFCHGYARRCAPEQFGTLRFAIVGAEKLRAPVAEEFKAHFGIGLLEGYGCTEMAPVVAVSRPDIETDGQIIRGSKPGSIGPPIPGVAVKITDIEGGHDLPRGREGLLLARGPNVMAGYLGEPQRTAGAIRDGWYVTGDIARIDEEGFIFITDRLTRFSKIAGEMVPHLKVEDAIDAVVGAGASIVTAIPDAAKGERLVAFYAAPDVTADVVWDRLNASDLPRLWLPRRDCLVPIEAIPTLATGKVDLRRVRELAAAHDAATTASLR